MLRTLPERDRLLNTIIPPQNSKLQAQRCIIRVQNSKLQARSLKLREQNSELEPQNSIIRDQNSIIRDQNSIIRVQSFVIRVQNLILEDQNLNLGNLQRGDTFGGLRQRTLFSKVVLRMLERSFKSFRIYAVASSVSPC